MNFLKNSTESFLKNSSGSFLTKPELTELCFEANTAGSTVELGASAATLAKISSTAYSRDRITWTAFTPADEAGTNTITLTNIGDKVYFRNNINSDFDDDCVIGFFMTGSIAASGNINSLYSYNNFNNITTLIYKGCFKMMFYECTSLTTAPELPATTLSESCYYCMFADCDSLITSPKLPATTLAASCYEGMFSGCTSLQVAPKLPATVLADSCYTSMFSQCTSLVTAPPVLPALTLTNNCYDEMFAECTSLCMPPSIYATTLAQNCCDSMFASCGSLTTVPKLYATALQSQCYHFMFFGCVSLYVSDTSSTSYSYAWKIPTSGTFTNTTSYKQGDMFTACLGTRSSSSISGAQGESHTYYTQNEPV